LTDYIIIGIDEFDLLQKKDDLTFEGKKKMNF